MNALSTPAEEENARSDESNETIENLTKYETPGGAEAALHQHRLSPGPTVLCSPAMTEGIDLADDLSRFQVIVKVLAQMQGAERGLARLEAARARLAPEVVQKVIVSLNTPPAKVEDLQSLHSMVVALEKEVEEVQTDP
jgi:hypothetical protein